jgi:hypothetical protein
VPRIEKRNLSRVECRAILESNQTNHHPKKVRPSVPSNNATRIPMKEEMNTPSKSPAAVLGSDDSFRLLVEGVKDYAIVMLDPGGMSSAGTRAPSASRAIVPRRSSASTSPAFIRPRPSSAACPNRN